MNLKLIYVAIRNFFYPQPICFSYSLPKKMVKYRIREILRRKSSLFDSNHLDGKFKSENTFEIWRKNKTSNSHSFFLMKGEILESPTVGTII